MHAGAPPAIALHGVSKRYRLRGSARRRLRDLLLGRGGGEHWALRDVSLHVSAGETVGIIGGNGAGKSTLLGLIAGAASPTEGTVIARGKVAALLELGAGFHPDWTGRENAEFHMRLRGASRREALALVEAVEDFADIGDYFDQPLRACSSGMAMRVAFAAAVAIEPEIIVVDEALTVGDASFQHKCFKRLAEFRDRGVTTLLVTHQLDLVAQVCDRAVLLDGGKLLFDGPPRPAVERYVDLLLGQSRSGDPADPAATQYRTGSGEAEIAQVAVSTRSFASGDTATFTVRMAFREAVERPVLGFALRTVQSVVLYGTSTELLGVPLAPAAPGEVRELRVECPLPLAPGAVFVDFSAAGMIAGELRIFDARMAMLELDIRSRGGFVGLVNLAAIITPARRG